MADIIAELGNLIMELEQIAAPKEKTQKKEMEPQSVVEELRGVEQAYYDDKKPEEYGELQKPEPTQPVTVVQDTHQPVSAGPSTQWSQRNTLYEEVSAFLDDILSFLAQYNPPTKPTGDENAIYGTPDMGVYRLWEEDCPTCANFQQVIEAAIGRQDMKEANKLLDDFAKHINEAHSSREAARKSKKLTRRVSKEALNNLLRSPTIEVRSYAPIQNTDLFEVVYVKKEEPDAYHVGE